MPGYPAVLCGILDSSGLAACSPEINSLDLIWRILLMKARAMPDANLAAPTSVHRCRMGLPSNGINPQELPLIPQPPGGHRGKKWGLYWIDGQPTAQHVSTSTFRAKVSFNKTWRSIYWKNAVQSTIERPPCIYVHIWISLVYMGSFQKSLELIKCNYFHIVIYRQKSTEKFRMQRLKDILKTIA